MEDKVDKSKTKRWSIPVPAIVALAWIVVYLPLKLLVQPPLPSSIIFMYMTAVSVGLALAVSIYEPILDRFITPIVWFFRGDDDQPLFWRAARIVLLVAFPLYVGLGVYQRVVPRFEPPIAPRVIHPAPPPEVAALYNEYREDEANRAKYVEEGEVVYFQNCFFCHGDALDGEGPFAHGINPPPADFQDSGTIAQLTESFVYWRISTGGPGLPDESTPWDSFMPRWETMLSKEQRWKVILYLYDLTGWSPRTWGESEAISEFEPLEDEEGKEKADGEAKKDEADKGDAKKGNDLEVIRKTFNKRCAPCHGKEGKGDGPGANFMFPHPRNFTWGVYKFTTTPTGFPPTDEDLFRTIRHGLPGTAMPGWPMLTDDEIKGLISYIKAFAPDVFEEEEEKPQSIQIGTPPKASPELIEKGKKLFDDAKCFECHGRKGRGDEMKALKDDWGFRVYPRNLTHPWEYRGTEEPTVEYIYGVIATGISGTPMPSFKEPPLSFSDEDLWAIAHYVRSIQSPKQPGYTLVVKQVEKLPTTPEDPAWDEVAHLDIPMVGQVIKDPRMFIPRVDNVRVQALYNEKDVTFRLVWDDTTETKADPSAGIFEDSVAIQFPVTIPTGSKRPYFLMGDSDHPVHLWRWSSEKSNALELNARGTEKIQPQGDSSQQVMGKLKYDNGRYSLILTRPLSTPDKDKDIQFLPGKFIPMSFFAWDGTNKETGIQNSLSAWYFLLLEPVTPVTVYIFPFVAILAMVGAQWWFIRRIRNNKRRDV